MKNAAFSIEELFRFLDAGVSAFHSTAAAAAILEAEGYVNCPESAAWELTPGGKYYTTRNGSAVLAWRMPKGELTGWHVTASHSDSPTWRIKQLDGGKDAFQHRCTQLRAVQNVKAGIGGGGIHQGGAHLMRGTAQRRMGAKHFSAAIRRVGVGVHDAAGHLDQLAHMAPMPSAAYSSCGRR